MWLILRRGRGSRRRVQVTGERFLIGRADDCDLKLEDDNASRWHAYLEALPDGLARLHDLDSANGTFVDGHRITQATVLEGGEQLQFGDAVIMTSRHEPPKERPTAAGTDASAGVSAIRRAIRSDSMIRAAIGAPRRAGRTAAMVAVATVAATVATLLALGVGARGPSAADAVAKVAPAIALVETLDRDGARTGTGSAFVIDADAGLAITNAHVVNDGARFRLAVGGRAREAKIVGSAPCEDLALLRVSDTRGLKTAVELGRQSDLRRGETVVAVGYPGNASLKDELTSTEGVVSVVRTSYREAASDVPEFTNVVQTDAAINPGNSGGPLVDLQGRLAGVNSAGRTTAQDGRVIQGQGYAIGVDRVRSVIMSLRAGRSTGWPGFGFGYPTTETLVEAGLPAGVRIGHVVPGTPAERLGLEDGSSYVIDVDGTPIDNSLAGWCRAAGRIASGQSARLGIVRSGSSRIRRISVRFP